MKQERLELRTSKVDRARFAEAAAFTGMTLSAFLRQAALEKSEIVLKNRDDLTLSNRDRDLFLEALEKPTKPNKQLREAFKKYQNLRKGNIKTPSAKKTRSRIKKLKTSI